MTTRRLAIRCLAGGAIAARLQAADRLDAIFGDTTGVAVAIDFKSGQLLAAHRMETARSTLAPPGSTLKPLVLRTLLDAGKLRATDTHPCSGSLKIAGRSFACVHPRTSAPIDLTTAIAYSCNEYVAHAAARFAPGELARALGTWGLTSRTGLAGANEAGGRIEPASGVEQNQLQALGEEHVAVTVFGLATAYRKLAAQSGAILEGLEAAVEFGTAQRAQIPGVRVAGKTGSAGVSYAWFAGFAPSRAPKSVVAVMVQGRSGGADAAPIGGRILAASLEGKL